MHIAVTSTGTGLDSEVDQRFGRARYIVIVDTENMSSRALDNSENLNALKGAGIQAAKMISEAGAQVLLTGFCGPNAFKALSAAGIAVANNARGTVKEAVEAYLRGEYPHSDGANAEGQW